MTLRAQLETLESREVPAAKLQFVNNSPYATMALVDVYVNDNLLLDNFPYQSATAFLDVASQTNLKVDFTASTAANNTSPLATATLNLPDNSQTTAAALGNPGTASFKLATASTRSVATNPNAVEYLILNGTPDTPIVDIRIRGVGTTADDLAFGKYSAGYQSLTPADYIADALSNTSPVPLGGAMLNLAETKGAALILMTSGFVTPAAGDPGFSFLGVNGDGSTVRYAAHFDPAYAVASVTAKGATAILASANGTATQTIIAFPSSTTPARVASADFTGDGVPDLIVGSGPGSPGFVRIFDGSTGDLIHEIDAFGNFTGGINVAAGDINGDGTPDYAFSPDDGGGPRVRLFNGKTNAQIADFFGIDDVNFRGGARAAIGDMNNDGKGDLLVAAGIGGGPRVAIFNGATLGATGGPKFLGDFFAFEPELRNGAYIAAGDINGDGFADLLVGGGPGGGPRVRVMDGKALTAVNSQQTVLADFFAGDINERGGVRLTAKDIDGDGLDDLIVGGSFGANTVTRTFLSKNLPLSGVGTPTYTTTTFDGTTPLGEVFVG